MQLNRGVEFKYHGHATFSMKTSTGRRIVIDPWLKENPVCPEADKQLDGVDIQLLTHGHFDHVADAVDISKRFTPVTVCNFEISLWLEAQGCSNVSPMNKGGSQVFDDLRITMVDAKHSSSIQDEQGRLVYLGEPAGYVLTFGDEFSVYFAGDTCVFGDMALIAELYRPELAVLPIGDLFTMGPAEAAHACKLLKVRKVIPCHFGTFPILTGTPEEFRERTRDLGVNVIELDPGESVA